MNTTKPVWKASVGANLYVNSVGISDAGRHVIAGSYFYAYDQSHTPAAQLYIVGIFLWDAAGNLRWSDTFHATEGVYWVTLSRDSAWAAGGGLGAPEEGFVFAYDVATGKRTLKHKIPVRVNRVALSGDGSCLVAGADVTYFFLRHDSHWSAPQIIPCQVDGDYVVSVDMSDDGQWVVAGTYKGFVLLMQNNNGVFSRVAYWQQKDGTIHWVAMAADGSGFVAGASSASALYFNTSDFKVSPQPTWTALLPGCTRCGCVAISGDGSLVSAVGNAKSTGQDADKDAGLVFLFENQDGAAQQLWSRPTRHSPNSTSLDAAGQFVTASDGFPDGKRGSFYLYDKAGNLQWRFVTSNMSWPMQLSSNGAAIAAGSDNSDVYFFRTPRHEISAAPGK